MSKKINIKIINICVIVVFSLIILIPIITMNHKKDVVSEIDNRKLTENPFSKEMRTRPDANFAKDVFHYIGDRIGFRNEMIKGWTIANDKLFSEMVHPTYCYGQNGYVFFKGMTPPQYSDYHKTFADTVEKIQKYCDERNIPFVFVFEPIKNSVYKEYLPKGVKWENVWVDKFIEDLSNRNINYVNNTPLLIQKKNKGEVVFNQKYNAGHWNDLGAFYGVNNILSNLQKYFPTLELNKKDDFEITQALRTSLPVSKFPIYEYEPIFTPKEKIENLYDTYSPETERNPNYRGFGYFVNESKKSKSSPKALVFQGSYMNGMGWKMLENAFSEYVYIHDYQNTLELPYYLNMYKTDCVIFEVAEYTFSDLYFNYNKMKNINWNPLLENFYKECSYDENNPISLKNYTVNKGNVFTKIQWQSDQEFEYLWLIAGNEFDMRVKDDENHIYEVTIPNENYKSHEDDFFIVGANGNRLVIFK